MPGYRPMMSDGEAGCLAKGFVIGSGLALIALLVISAISIYTQIKAPKCPTCGVPYQLKE